MVRDRVHKGLVERDGLRVAISGPSYSACSASRRTRSGIPLGHGEKRQQTGGRATSESRRACRGRDTENAWHSSAAEGVVPGLICGFGGHERQGGDFTMARNKAARNGCPRLCQVPPTPAPPPPPSPPGQGLRRKKGSKRAMCAAPSEWPCAIHLGAVDGLRVDPP